MIQAARILLFMAGTVFVMLATGLFLFGGLTALQRGFDAAWWQLSLAIVLIWAGTFGTARVDKRLKARRDRIRTIAAQEREFA